MIELNYKLAHSWLPWTFSTLTSCVTTLLKSVSFVQETGVLHGAEIYNNIFDMIRLKDFESLCTSIRVIRLLPILIVQNAMCRLLLRYLSTI